MFCALTVYCFRGICFCPAKDDHASITGSFADAFMLRPCGETVVGYEAQSGTSFSSGLPGVLADKLGPTVLPFGLRYV